MRAWQLLHIVGSRGWPNLAFLTKKPNITRVQINWEYTRYWNITNHFRYNTDICNLPPFSSSLSNRSPDKCDFHWKKRANPCVRFTQFELWLQTNIKNDFGTNIHQIGAVMEKSAVLLQNYDITNIFRLRKVVLRWRYRSFHRRHGNHNIWYCGHIAKNPETYQLALSISHEASNVVLRIIIIDYW